MDELNKLLSYWIQWAGRGRITSDEYATWNIFIEAAYSHAMLEQVRPLSKVIVGLPSSWSDSSPPIEVEYANAVLSTISNIKAVIQVKEEYPVKAIPSLPKGVPPFVGNTVFIVHGHSDVVRLEIEKFVKALGLQPIILFELPNRGQTIIEKFERETNVGFAIALLTADDVATCNRDKKVEMRARQNVVFELGYFVGKLGRGRVAVLKESGVAEPSDLHGIVYTEIDDRGAWKFELAKKLKAAGFVIDINGVI
jgi:predicted nucleotide-binding protein